MVEHKVLLFGVTPRADANPHKSHSLYIGTWLKQTEFEMLYKSGVIVAEFPTVCVCVCVDNND